MKTTNHKLSVVLNAKMRIMTMLILMIAFTAPTFGQKLSKDETVEYIKQLLIGQSLCYNCGSDGPVLRDILEVTASDGILKIAHDFKGFKKTSEVILHGKFVAIPKKFCNEDFYSIEEDASRGFDINKTNAERLVKALNYLSTICVDPFK